MESLFRTCCPGLYMKNDVRRNKSSAKRRPKLYAMSSVVVVQEAADSCLDLKMRVSTPTINVQDDD